MLALYVEIRFLTKTKQNGSNAFKCQQLKIIPGVFPVI